jgi:hypothetical protein
VSAFWASFGGAATAFAAVGTLFTFFIRHGLDRRLARLNSDLQRELSRVNRLDAIHTEKIPEIFSRTVKIDSLVERLFTSTLGLGISNAAVKIQREECVGQLHQELMDARYELLEFSKLNAVYFSKSLIEILKDFDIALLDVTLDINQVKGTQEEISAKCPAVRHGQQRLRNVVSKIELVFKQLLGVEEQGAS